MTTDCIVVAMSCNVKNNNNHSTYVPTHTTYLRIPICAMATDGSGSAASELEVGFIYPTMQELRAPAANQADTCHSRGVVRGAKGGEGVSAYVSIYMGGKGGTMKDH